MKIYIIFDFVMWEGDGFICAFSSRAEAEKFVEQNKSNHLDYEELRVEEYDLNSGPKRFQNSVPFKE